MNNMTLRVEIVKSMKYHLKQYLQHVRRYHITDKPFAVYPEGFSQRFKDKTEMSRQPML